MGETKRIFASYHCRACDVEGRDPVPEDGETICWYCGGKPEVITHYAESSPGMLHIPLLISQRLPDAD